MRKYGIILLLLICNFYGNTQEYFKQGSFVLKGKVNNPTQPFFEFSLTNFLGSETHSVPLRKDGSFEKNFPIQHRQEMIVRIGEDGVQLLVEKGDTLTLNWDDNQVRNTFSVHAAGAVRNRDLQLQYKLDTSLRLQGEQMQEYIYVNKNKISAKERYEKVNEAFNRHLQAALTQTDFVQEPFTRHQTNLAIGLYYHYTNLLFQYQLLPEYKLQHRIDIPYRWLLDQGNYVTFGKDYNQLYEAWFRDIPQYRQFIYQYARMFTPFPIAQGLVGTPTKKFNPVLDQYYRAQSDFFILPIRDWFLTKYVMEGFDYYNFSDVEGVYQRVITEIGSPYLKDALEKHYAAITRLKPGNMAPEFILKDDKGNMVRLSDFRGKVIYMNWWGVYCSPCIYEIQNHEADLHQQFKGKDVVFVNVCVGSEEKEWKTALKKYKLEGVNLTAPGWTDDPACKAYNIDAVPHYVIIDEKGNIVNNNAPRPSELKEQGENNELNRTLDIKAL